AGCPAKQWHDNRTVASQLSKRSPDEPTRNFSVRLGYEEPVEVSTELAVGLLVAADVGRVHHRQRAGGADNGRYAEHDVGRLQIAGRTDLHAGSVCTEVIRPAADGVSVFCGGVVVEFDDGCEAVDVFITVPVAVQP